MGIRRAVVSAVAAMLLLAAAPAHAEDKYATAKGKSKPVYTESVLEEFWIPTAYGRLYGWVRRPITPAGVKVPVILTYSPYHLLESQAAGFETDETTASYFVPRGYARAWVHLVGTGRSEGCYDYGGTRDVKTGAAVVDWLGKRPWSNGRVGMIGGSYDGTTQWATAIEAPRHLETIVPQVAIDRWYDYAHYNGVRSNSGWGGTPNLFTLGFNFGVPDPAGYQAVIDSVQPCENLRHNERAYEPDPVYDGFWDERDYTTRARNIEASVLLEGSWTDGNVLPHNSLRMWRALPDGIDKRFVMALQGHGGSNLADAMNIRHAWFDRYLLKLDTGVEDLPASDSVDVATRKRRQDASWPPPDTRTAALRLETGTAAHGTLALRNPTPAWTDNNPQQNEADVMSGAITGAGIVFAGKPVASDVRIVDEPRVVLPLHTNQISTHVHAVLFDESPEGTRRTIVRGAINSRNRASERTTAPLAPGEEWTARFGLLPTDWVLRKGHRLGVALMSNNESFSPYGDETRARNEVLLHRGAHVFVPVAGDAEALGTVVERRSTAAAPRPAARTPEPTPSTAAAPSAQPATPFTVSLAVDRRRLRRALPGGLRARVKCSLACTARVTLRDARGRTVATGLVKRARAGRRSFTVRFRPAAVRRLRGARRVRLTLSGRARAGLQARTVTRRLTLNR